MPLINKIIGEKYKNSKLHNLFNKTLVRQAIIYIVFTVLLSIIVVSNIMSAKIVLKPGEIAVENIRATKEIVDEEATNRLKEEAMNEIEPVYEVNPAVSVKIKNQIKGLFKYIYDFKQEAEGDQALAIDYLKNNFEFKLTDNNYKTLLNEDIEVLKKLENYIVYDIINPFMALGIKEEELEYEKENISKVFNSLDDLPSDIKIIGQDIVHKTLKPNKFLDFETTQSKRQEASESIDPVIIKEGALIVSKGEKITQKTLDLVKKAGILRANDGTDIKLIAGGFLLVLIFQAIIIGYLFVLDKDILKNTKKITILAIIILGALIISKAIYNISPYLMPISAAAMLISILINPKLSVLINFIISILLGVITGNDINVVTMCIIGGTVGAIGVVYANQRHNIFLTGLLISLVNVISIITFGLIGDLGYTDIIKDSIYGIINGVFSAVLTIGSLPFWEGVFSVVTPLKLLELSNPNNPLLKKLLLEAPGTYHHSIIVGNLAENAAEAINCNPLVVRVGAYYHDIGKLKRPYFFKENQLGSDNPHDKINPSLSTLIITSHIKDGIELAQKYKIPNVIKDIIQEHHGDTLVAFFYHKAMNGENPDLVQEDSFRYSGPKPQSKEAALIMIADSVEAAVRSIQQPTKGKIEALVRQIIKSKLDDGQLDECDLTLKDLNIIANSFLNVLFGIFHERIEYPKLNLKELKGGN
ncbi:HD family phosphohydrolase [Clostridiisalibacter paucivorans]|uniref:HD family phosphohydrolase n=1 Tax=Clostridiisalibacter paucivorans TaxID=408753 RepID=UPI00047BDD9E|nr:HDIG domain-containing metalloprotein [Clostridiisalibacter paucivorans]